MGKYTQERTASLWTVLGAVASAIDAVISLLGLVYSIAKDRKNKSNRHSDQG